VHVVCDLCRWGAICAGGVRSVHVVCDLCRWGATCAGGVRSVQVGCDLCMWCATLQPSGCVKTERNIVFGAFLRNEALWLQGRRQNRKNLII
jgi:hypothetical protein